MGNFLKDLGKDAGDFYANPWNKALGKGRGTGASMLPTYSARDRLAEAERQRAAGITAPSSRGFQAQGLKPGDPGFWQDRSRSYIWRDQTGGFDSLLRQYEGGGDSVGAIEDLLKTFQGDREELADFLEVAGPLMGGLEARKLEGSAGLGYMADQGNWDMGAMAGYGAGAGQIGRGTAQARSGAAQMLGRSGLGRGTARTAIDSMLQMQGSGQQAGLMAQATQQAGMNRMQSAQGLMDAHRTIAQLALGQSPTPRIQSPQGTNSGMGWQQGALAGAGAGAALGPWGALIGGLAGAGLGASASK